MRAATFGAMDGLVSNTALIAGVAAAAEAHTVVISGVAGLLAGAFSMALGEYTSVTTANEQIESEVRVEQRAFRVHPQAERAELVAMLVNHGHDAGDRRHRPPTKSTATRAGRVNFHLVQELGVDPAEKPSPWVAAGLVVRHVRDRCHRAADPVPARIRVAVGGPALRRRRSVDRRWSRGTVHQ